MKDYKYNGMVNRYPAAVKPLIKELTAMINELDGKTGDAFWCSGPAWKARGEDYCTGADAVLVIDGSSLYAILNYCEAVSLYDKFYKICEKYGYYFELGCGWYGGLYKINPTPKAEKSRVKKENSPAMKLEDVTLDLVKSSRFGCTYCLLAGAECKMYEKFVPAMTSGSFGPQKASCNNYIYYD